MKRLLLLVLCLCGAYTFGRAQTNYYAGQTQVSGNGFVYKVQYQVGGLTKIYNANNQWTFVEWGCKDGLPPEKGLVFGGTSPVEEDNWTCPLSWSIVKNAFTNQQQSMLKGETLGVEMYIDTSTGKVSEVEFKFGTSSPFVSIPPSTYFSIEQKLKSQIWFVMTPAGKTLNYSICGWNQEF